MTFAIQTSRAARVKLFGRTIEYLAQFAADERIYPEDRVTRELLRDAGVIWRDIDDEAIGAPDVSVFCNRSIRTRDARASRVAWLMTGAAGVTVAAVNARLRHKRKREGVYSPLGTAVGLHLRREPEYAPLTDSAFDRTIDVVAVRGDEIIIAQGRACPHLDYNIFRESNQPTLWKREVFRTHASITKEVRALAPALRMLRSLFPSHRIRCLVVLVHPLPGRPEFEIHQIDPVRDRILSEDTLVSSCADIRGAILASPDAIFSMPARHTDDRLRHLPPDRGGRCTQLLAAMAREQLGSDELIWFSRPVLEEIAQSEYALSITKDKLRHDLDGRLNSLQLITHNDETGTYALTPRGLAWYFYMLRKYSCTRFELEHVIDQCDALEQRHREDELRNF